MERKRGTLNELSTNSIPISSTALLLSSLFVCRPHLTKQAKALKGLGIWWVNAPMPYPTLCYLGNRHAPQFLRVDA
ncbi:hypothetical protein OUZ56_004900 [Daphnia magna]|uniref:Uncharacterized protein n=1 Tax=Daphnia magna TaxID=35525 RepID=A0ABQ9YR75_9CRUS|nr:hypothetical protein OUZ56_004900 [Daphnia magna]